MDFNLEKVTWEQVREQVQKTNKELFKIIEELEPSQRHPLIKARYRFGDLIVRDGITYLPRKNGTLVPKDHADLSVDIKRLLDYSSIPLCLILEKSCEVFAKTSNRVIPLISLFPGNLFGTFESLDFLTNTPINPIWSVSAGARSLFMLPKIAETQGINRLRKFYKLPTTLPLKEFEEQWNIFKILSHQDNFEESWTCEVLFFPKVWLKNHTNTPWSVLHKYIMTLCWRQIQYTNAVGYIELSIVWQSFSEAIVNRNLTPRPYLVDTLKHLFAIAIGKYPAFIPAENTSLIAPVQKLQDIFINTYGIKGYYPTFMYPHHLDPSSDKPIYYSLSLPTLLDGNPEKNKISKIMKDLREIKLLMDTFWQRSEWVKKNANFQKIKFDFFHTETDTFGEIKNSETLLDDDKRFLHDHPTNNKFCMYSHFWRGCIRIRSKSI